jgi:hypothetical protein
MSSAEKPDANGAERFDADPEAWRKQFWGDDGASDPGDATPNSPLTKSSSADSVLSSRHNGNQRWRWGDQRLFRMI